MKDNTGARYIKIRVNISGNVVVEKEEDEMFCEGSPTYKKMVDYFKEILKDEGYPILQDIKVKSGSPKIMSDWLYLGPKLAFSREKLPKNKVNKKVDGRK